MVHVPPCGEGLIMEIPQVMENAGLIVERRAYYFGLIFPLVVAVRLASRLFGRSTVESHSDLRQHSALTNSILSLVCRVELPFFRFIRLAGVSLVCMARKP